MILAFIANRHRRQMPNFYAALRKEMLDILPNAGTTAEIVMTRGETIIQLLKLVGGVVIATLLYLIYQKL